jgi:mRNA-degrading endonuclease YafQ of YafQ-DinJ toxin-antitoxin module
MLINVGIAAYVVGTFTLVVTKDDEAASTRRSLMKSLKQFTVMNNLYERDGRREKEHPLVGEVRGHLELHLEHDQVRLF